MDSVLPLSARIFTVALDVFVTFLVDCEKAFVLEDNIDIISGVLEEEQRESSMDFALSLTGRNYPYLSLLSLVIQECKRRSAKLKMVKLHLDLVEHFSHDSRLILNKSFFSAEVLVSLSNRVECIDQVILVFDDHLFVVLLGLCLPLIQGDIFKTTSLSSWHSWQALSRFDHAIKAF